MKNRSTLSIIFLSIALVVTTIGIGFLFYTLNLKMLENVSFYVLCVVWLTLFITLILAFTNLKSSKYIQTLENRLSLWNTISYKVKGAGETAFNDFPVGVIVLDNSYKIKWSNPMAQSIAISNLKDKSLKEIANSKLYDFVVENEKNEENVITSEISLFHKIYRIQFVKDLRIIYLRDITEFVDLTNKYKNRTLALGYINIDNLEEALSELDFQGKNEYQGKIGTAIVKWAESFGAFIKAYSDSKFMIMTDYEHLLLMMENDFTVLDDIKLLLKTTKAVHITLSIGMCCEDLPVDELSEMAEEQLDLALSRGGDQAIVKLNGKTTFYGAKTEPTRKESKVELRYYYEKLESTIKNFNTVFCMGHKFQDADSFGSTIAMYNFAIALGKKAYIILDESSIDTTVKKVYEDVKKYHKVLHKVFITPEKACEMVNDKTILMVLDCQAESQLCLTDKQFKLFKNIGVIDHHRKNDAGTIENTIFYYAEPAASSCVEVIFTLLEFSDYELSVSDNEATWMLLGMVVDTNNFVYRSSDITFETASKLAKMQANMGKVKEYLKEKKEEKLLRTRFISDIECYRDNVAIATQTDHAELEAATLAKVSDELLSIEGFILAVTCGYTKGGVIRLSARSLGKVNCQVLMEKLGGGGHLTAAATAIKGKSMQEVNRLLKNAIDIVLKSDNMLKVILTEDVKNKGQKGEILNLDLQQAQNLLRNNLAIEATAENIRLLEQEKREEQEAKSLKLVEFYEIKAKIEEKPINIEVSVDEDGHILDIVNTKTIANALSNVIKQKIDRRKVIFNINVEALGAYEAQIQLYKDIYATVNFYVVEKTSK